jgi:hypothetical protein
MAISTIGYDAAGNPGDFTTLQAWLDSLPVPPAAWSEGQTGRLLRYGTSSQGPHSVSTEVTFGTNSWQHETAEDKRIVLECASGASFLDNPATTLRADLANGALLTTTAGYGNVLKIYDPYVTLRGLQVSAPVGPGVAVYTWNQGGYCIVDRCLILANATGNSPCYVHFNGTVKDCVVISTRNAATAGVKINGAGGLICNNTIVRPAFIPPSDLDTDTGIVSIYGNTVARNNAIFGFKIPIAHQGNTPLLSGSGNNATDAASIGAMDAGSGNLTGLTYADQFRNVGAGSDWASTIDPYPKPARRCSMRPSPTRTTCRSTCSGRPVRRAVPPTSGPLRCRWQPRRPACCASARRACSTSAWGAIRDE